MVKKVKKYVKSVLCVVLMLSLLMPIYAANEASDPSAFVTKEEFDKALADFNRRLNTFEAGINSKIDNQVTSYLDRNGIWSGKNQELLNPLYSTTGVPFPEKGFNQFFSDKTTASYTTSDISLKYGANYIIDLLNEKICTSNKTGMIYMIFEIESHSAMPKNKRWQLTSNGTGYNGLVVEFGKGQSTWSTYKPKSSATKNDPIEVKLNSMEAVMGSKILASQEGTNCYVYYPDILPISFSFFVDTGDAVWVRMWNQLICGGDSTDYTNKIVNTSFCGMFKAAAERPTFRVVDAKIY